MLTSQTAFLILRVLEAELHTKASIASDVLGLVAILGATVFSWFHHSQSIRPSTLLEVYLGVTVLVDIVRLRTLWFLPGATGAAATFSLLLAFSCGALVLESARKVKCLRSSHEYANAGSEPFSGLWERTGYAWLVATVRQGYRKLLTVDDLPPLNPQLKSERLQSELENAWNRCEGCRLNPERHVSGVLTYVRQKQVIQE
jgi:ATP-binding cassette, subfamily C (CFTR/MRP), member 1